jgi:hypothetical protein
MKYIVGVVGGIFVFIVVYFIIAYILVAWSPQFLAEHIPIAVSGINNPIALILAALAATSSFRASIKPKGKKKPSSKKVPPP